MDAWMTQTYSSKPPLYAAQLQVHGHTHQNKVSVPFGPEVPFDGGRTFHLTSPLAGDATQLEALACYGLSVRVHLCTGPLTLVHCLQGTMQSANILG